MESSSTGRTEWRHTAVHCQRHTCWNTGDISVPHKHYQHYRNIPSTIHNIFLHHCSKNSHRKWPIQPLLFHSNARKRSAINTHEYHYVYMPIHTQLHCVCIFIFNNIREPVVFVLFSVPSSSPEHLGGVPVSPTSIHLTWDPPPLEHHNGEIDGYRVNVSEIATGQFTQHFSNQTQITIGNLRPFHAYHCQVTAVTVGEGPYTDVVVVVTNEAGKCGAISYPRLNLSFQN